MRNLGILAWSGFPGNSVSGSIEFFRFLELILRIPIIQIGIILILRIDSNISINSNWNY